MKGMSTRLFEWARRLKKCAGVLLVVNAALTAVLFSSMITGIFRLDHRADAVGTESDRDVVILETEPIDEATVSRAILGKAVFRTYRKVEQRVVDELGRFELMGTSHDSEPERRSAFIKDTKRKRSLTLRVGDTLGGKFEVIAISRDGVSLRRGNEMLLLSKR